MQGPTVARDWEDGWVTGWPPGPGDGGDDGIIWPNGYTGEFV